MEIFYESDWHIHTEASYYAENIKCFISVTRRVHKVPGVLLQSIYIVLLYIFMGSNTTYLYTYIYGYIAMIGIFIIYNARSDNIMYIGHRK